MVQLLTLGVIPEMAQNRSEFIFAGIEFDYQPLYDRCDFTRG
jgi:hypothetical protein